MDKLRELIALTSVEIAVICGRFSRLKEQSKKPIGYHTLADMTAHFQRKKALNLFKSQVEGLTELTDAEVEVILDKGFSLVTKPTSQEHIQRIIQLQDCQRQLGGME